MFIKGKLEELGVTPSKGKGQNFLHDSSVVQKCIAFARIDSKSKVVEIGPGLGALTDVLQGICSNLCVIELESEFCQQIKKRFPKIEVVNDDVRNVDFSILGEELIIIGNIPYSVSSEVVFKLLDYHQCIRSASLLVQREFAERLAASHGSKRYGTISVQAQLLADVELGDIIPGSSFHPPAAVESMLVRMNFRKQPKYSVLDKALFKQVVKAAFATRRKTISNNLSKLIGSKDLTIHLLEQVGIKPNVRIEEISVGKLVELTNAISEDDTSI